MLNFSTYFLFWEDGEAELFGRLFICLSFSLREPGGCEEWRLPKSLRLRKSGVGGHFASNEQDEDNEDGEEDEEDNGVPQNHGRRAASCLRSRND